MAEEGHATFEEALASLKDIGDSNDVFKRLLQEKFVNSNLYHTQASNPAGPGFLIGEKDVSTAARQAGKREFGNILFKDEDFDGTASHPEYWQLTDQKKAFILIVPWMGTVHNHNNWLAKEFEVEIQEAELGVGEIMALNQVVQTAREYYYNEFGWNLPAVAAGNAYWYRVVLPKSANPQKMAVFVLTTVGRVGGWKKREQEINRALSRFLSTLHYWVESHRQSLDIFTHVQLYSNEVQVSSMFQEMVAKDECPLLNNPGNIEEFHRAAFSKVLISNFN